MKLTIKILVGVLLLIFSAGAYAWFVPRVVWSEAELRLPSIASGESYTQTVTLTRTHWPHIHGTHQLQVLVKGAIAEYVTVTQPEFPTRWKKHQPLTLTVTITAPENIPLTILEGKIVLKRVLRNGQAFPVLTAAKLPVTITFSDIDLPPFPDLDIDEETILGTDADEDGVPDRVEYWIAEVSPESEKTRAALSLKAEKQQSVLVDFLAHLGEDPEDEAVRTRVRAVANIRAKASGCLRHLMGAAGSLPGEPVWSEYWKTSRGLDAEFYNTPLRLQALKDAERALIGSSAPNVENDQHLQQCLDLNLNPDSFSN